MKKIILTEHKIEIEPSDWNDDSHEYEGVSYDNRNMKLKLEPYENNPIDGGKIANKIDGIIEFIAFLSMDGISVEHPKFIKSLESTLDTLIDDYREQK